MRLWRLSQWRILVFAPFAAGSLALGAPRAGTADASVARGGPISHARQKVGSRAAALRRRLSFNASVSAAAVPSSERATQDSATPGGSADAAHAREETDEEVVSAVTGPCWAAAVAAYKNASAQPGAESQPFAEVPLAFGRRREYKRDLCPRIRDWETETVLVHEMDTRASIYRSRSRRLAIVSFRGTVLSSRQNRQIDMDTDVVPVDLGARGGTAHVHHGFLKATKSLAEVVRAWLEGPRAANPKTLLRSAPEAGIPDTWTLAFTGFSMGGAIAILTATLADLQGWSRKPDAVVTFGAPKVADKAFADYWNQTGLCSRLLRVNAERDMIVRMPGYVTDLVRQPKVVTLDGANGTSSMGRWTSICPNRARWVSPGRTGISRLWQDLTLQSLFGAHKLMSCSTGYTVGFLHSGFPDLDDYCGVSSKICWNQSA
mmetsp:Transcript_22020/g.61628  ORF Transcript_22020/g.61628 Transcript_22020/m.61628 type:complete len:432 (-) Transcript_22020:95-1390(-)